MKKANRPPIRLDLRNHDSGVVSGDEFGTPPLPSRVFLAYFLVAGLAARWESPAGDLGEHNA